MGDGHDGLGDGFPHLVVHILDLMVLVQMVLRNLMRLFFDHDLGLELAPWNEPITDVLEHGDSRRFCLPIVDHPDWSG